jgi:hypothetical protein
MPGNTEAETVSAHTMLAALDTQGILIAYIYDYRGIIRDALTRSHPNSLRWLLRGSDDE